jgi:hypothetical protein
MTTDEAIEYIFSKIGRPLPISKSVGMGHAGAMKAVVQSDGTVRVEGWISTPLRDIEGDILEPESFSGEALAGYMQRGAPVSMEHNTNDIPVGYLTKSVLVKNGLILQTEENPDYPGTNFHYFSGGSGWYGSGVIDNKDAAVHVVTGKIKSFSWIGMPNVWEGLPGKGRHFKTAGAINPLMETTITAYPINTSATLRIAKALGYVPKISMTEFITFLKDEDKGVEIINLLVPAARQTARSTATGVLDMASHPAEREIVNYFKEK